MPTGPEVGIDLGHAISFYGLAGLTVFFTLMAVSLRNIFHAVLFLVLSFVGVAGLYVTLNADFLAMIQVIIYAGAIAVLMLFAMFLTRNAMAQGNPPGRLQASAAVTALLMFVVLVYVFLNTRWASGPSSPTGFIPEVLANAIFNNYLLPFELASVLLLVAMIGAILLVKE